MSPERPTEYADRVRAWAGLLRAGDTLTWAELLDTGRSGPGTSRPVPGSVAGSVPGAAQLEVVRRLDSALPEFDRLADLVLSTPAPGRGLVDVALPWPDEPPNDPARTGSPSVAPDELPAEELLRVGAGVLSRLLADEPDDARAAPSQPWRPWRRGFTLLGAPSTTAAMRTALLGRGLREGGARATCFVLGGPLEDLMAQRWSARVRAGAGMRWQRMWRTAATNDRVPPGIELPVLADRLADQLDPARVHVVLAADPAEAFATVADVLGVAPGPLVVPPDVLATDLLRRVNPVLALAVGREARDRAVARAWSDIADGEAPSRLRAPAGQHEWAVAAGERMAAALGAGRYAVHGDPSVVVPTPRPGIPRGPAPEDVLRHALVVLGSAWRRTVARGRTPGEA